MRGCFSSAELLMPSLRDMHVIVAKDLGTQAKFFLLMNELHYRYIVGVERLHIGRATRARRATPVDDERWFKISLTEAVNYFQRLRHTFSSFLED